MENVGVLWSLLVVALVIESLVNIVSNIQEKNKEWKYWLALALGLIGGALLSWNYNVDVFTLVGLEGNIPVIGPIVTGLIASRGSNLVSDFIGRINSWKKPT
jgi:hypothetical protein